MACDMAIIVYRTTSVEPAWVVVNNDFVDTAKEGLRKAGVPALAVIRFKKIVG